MATYTYIKYDNWEKYVTFNEPLDPALNNNIGTTWEDYINKKWVLLSPEQVAFHEEHPEATVHEVWNMEITPIPPRTLEEAKMEMLNKIAMYDGSENVNAFIVKIPAETEDEFIEMKAWLTQQERANYRSSIDSAKLLGVESLSLYIGDMPLTLPTPEAEEFLAQIQLYADACYIATKQHESTVKQMETIQEVDEYNYETGYPEMLVFTLS